MSPFRILSLDGGGIRGMVPALVLAELERRTGERVADMFDLIAGTSTGGILALGLTRPGPTGRPLYTANEMVDLYEKEGGRIFDRPTVHRLKALGNIADEKYPSDGIDEVLKARFGEARLAEAVTSVLVTAYDLEGRQPYFFKSHKARVSAHHDHRMRDVARATSAAPTYFEPARIEVKDNDKGYVALVDGGVYANNPSACALVEAICAFDQRLDDIVMLSLGTGEYTRPIQFEEAKGWGLAKWAQPVLNVVFDGVSDTVNYQLQSLLMKESRQSRYLRIQAKLNDRNDAMDDARPENMKEMRAVAGGMLREHDRSLDLIAAHLTGAAPWTPRSTVPGISPLALDLSSPKPVHPPTA